MRKNQRTPKSVARVARACVYVVPKRMRLMVDGSGMETNEYAASRPVVEDNECAHVREVMGVE